MPIPPVKQGSKIKLNPYLWKTEEEIKEMKVKEAEMKERLKLINYKLDELKVLDEATKKEYIKKILNEDIEVSRYIKGVHEMVENIED